MSLLPTTASPLMHVLAETFDARLASIPMPGPEAIRPETSPESFVPFLAWGWSVDLWDRDWPLSTKRQIVADALEMHRLKGTEAGIRKYLAYTAAQDVVVTAPPQDFYTSVGAENDPAWRRWIESLPEIRFYQVRQSSISGAGISVRGQEDGMPENCFLGAEVGDEPTFFAASELYNLDLEYAVMIDDGAEIPVATLREKDPRIGRRGDIVSFFLPGTAGSGAFASDLLLDGPWFLDGAPANRNSMMIALGPEVASGEGWALVEEQGDYIQDVQPAAGFYEVVSAAGFFVDHDHTNDATLAIADGAWGTYQAIRVMRPGLTMPPSASYLDADRLGMAPYTAELRMALPETVGPSALYFGAAYLGDSFATPETDLSALDFALDAISVSQSARDRLSVDLNIPPSGSLKTTRRLSSLQL